MTSAFSLEDIEHIKSRVEIFSCRAPVDILKDTDPCSRCMARWIRDAATAHDGGAIVRQLSRVDADDSGDDIPRGMLDLIRDAQIPSASALSLQRDVAAADLGAVDIRELRVEDWLRLPSWHVLRPLEQQRLLLSIDKWA